VIEAGPGVRDRVAAFKDRGNQVMYIQQMVAHPGSDLGVAFLGGDYLATYARQGSGTSWNTTTRSGGKYAPHKPSQEVLDLAWKAQDLFGLDFTCVDVVESPDGPMVFEVSAFGGFRGLLEANGIDAAALYTDYVLARI
jgi:ribosomal protein S6--L-glutamate ligase